MKKCVELPIVKPIYDVYHSQGSAGAVIAGNPSVRNWFLNHAIILSCDNRFLYSHHTPNVNVCHSALDSAPCLEERSVNTLYLNGCVHSVIRAMLDDGFYVYYTVIDDYFIRGKFGYRQWHFFHDGLICGYDRNEKTYSIFAYDENERYTVFKTPQSGFEAGRRYVKKHGGGVVGALCAIRPLPIRYELEPSTVCANLKEYLHFTPDGICLDYGATVYGSAVHNALALYLQRLTERKTDAPVFDKRAFKMLFEHKTVMAERLEATERMLQREPEFSRAYAQIVSDAELVWHRCLYYLQTERQSALVWMRDMILQIGKCEAEILTAFVSATEEAAQRN